MKATLALLAPLAVGLKVTLIVQLLPAASASAGKELLKKAMSGEGKK